MTAYAEVDEYRSDTGDMTTDEGVLAQELDVLSARLRAEAGISEETDLSDDASILARALVVDAARKKFATMAMGSVEIPVGVSGFTQSANGFSETWQVSNASGSAYWDRRMLDDFKSLVGNPTQSLCWGLIA